MKIITIGLFIFGNCTNKVCHSLIVRLVLMDVNLSVWRVLDRCQVFVEGAHDYNTITLTRVSHGVTRVPNDVVIV